MYKKPACRPVSDAWKGITQQHWLAVIRDNGKLLVSNLSTPLRNVNVGYAQALYASNAGITLQQKDSSIFLKRFVVADAFP